LFSESHCHLRRLSDDAIEKAESAGVVLVLTAGIDVASSELAVQTARKYSIVKACVGIHPWNADQYSEDAIRRLRELAADAEVVAVSEIGLDYMGRRNSEGRYVEQYIDKGIQRTAFREQLRMGRELGLPVIVHDRTPDQEVLDIIGEEGSAEPGAAIHGFSKDAAYAERCLDMGIYLSLGSRTISAPGNEALMEVVRETPLEWLLTETDSGSPEGVLIIAEKIAELKGLTRDEVGRATTRNLRKLTGL
jgi:TatD DNase family protein